MDLRSLEKKYHFESEIRQNQEISNFVQCKPIEKMGHEPRNRIFTKQKDTISKEKVPFQVFILKTTSSFEENCKIKEFEIFNLEFEKYV